MVSMLYGIDTKMSIINEDYKIKYIVSIPLVVLIHKDQVYKDQCIK